MSHSLCLTTDDGFETEITEQPDLTLRITVTGMVGRSWTGDRATVEEAIALAFRIRIEQAEGAAALSGLFGEGIVVPAAQQTQTSDGSAPLDPPALGCVTEIAGHASLNGWETA